jgi:hypothetical protein
MSVQDRLEFRRKYEERKHQSEHPRVPAWDPTARATAWLAATTFALFVVAVGQLYALFRTDETQRESFATQREQFVIANRAKIAVASAMLADALDRARSSLIVVLHQNTGSAAAADLATDSEIGFLPRRKIDSGSESIPWSLIVFPANAHCDVARGKAPMRQSLGEAQNHIEIISLDPSLWVKWDRKAASEGATKPAFDAVLAGEATVYVQGCDSFRTFGRQEPHSFCYYFDSESKSVTYPLSLVKCPASAE